MLGQYLAIRRVILATSLHVIGSYMQSCSIATGRGDVRKKEKRYNLAMAKLYPFPHRLLYVPFVLGRTESTLKKNRIPTVTARMRRANLCALAWAKCQAAGKKLSAVTHSRLLRVCHCVALFPSSLLWSQSCAQNEGRDAHRRSIVARCFPVLIFSWFSRFRQCARTRWLRVHFGPDHVWSSVGQMARKVSE
jgi:hypothetical protein